MNMIDSSCWLEFFAGTEQGKQFSTLLRKNEELIVPTITIYEVFKRVSTQTNEEEALKAIALMTTGKVVDLTQELAINAVLLSQSKHLPMADAMILATAQAYDATLWTLDEHFKGIDDVKWFKKA